MFYTENKENDANSQDDGSNKLLGDSTRQMVRRSVLKEFDPLAVDSPLPRRNNQPIEEEDELFEDAETTLPMSKSFSINDSSYGTRDSWLIPELKDYRPRQLENLNDTGDFSFAECVENTSQFSTTSSDDFEFNYKSNTKKAVTSQHEQTEMDETLREPSCLPTTDESKHLCESTKPIIPYHVIQELANEPNQDQHSNKTKYLKEDKIEPNNVEQDGFFSNRDQNVSVTEQFEFCNSQKVETVQEGSTINSVPECNPDQLSIPPKAFQSKSHSLVTDQSRDTTGHIDTTGQAREAVEQMQENTSYEFVYNSQVSHKSTHDNHQILFVDIQLDTSLQSSSSKHQNLNDLASSLDPLNIEYGDETLTHPNIDQNNSLLHDAINATTTYNEENHSYSNEDNCNQSLSSPLSTAADKIVKDSLSASQNFDDSRRQTVESLESMKDEEGFYMHEKVPNSVQLNKTFDDTSSTEQNVNDLNRKCQAKERQLDKDLTPLDATFEASSTPRKEVIDDANLDRPQTVPSDIQIMHTSGAATDSYVSESLLENEILEEAIKSDKTEDQNESKPLLQNISKDNSIVIKEEGELELPINSSIVIACKETTKMGMVYSELEIEANEYKNSPKSDQSQLCEQTDLKSSLEPLLEIQNSHHPIVLREAYAKTEDTEFNLCVVPKQNTFESNKALEALAHSLNQTIDVEESAIVEDINLSNTSSEDLNITINARRVENQMLAVSDKLKPSEENCDERHLQNVINNSQSLVSNYEVVNTVSGQLKENINNIKPNIEPSKQDNFQNSDKLKDLKIEQFDEKGVFTATEYVGNGNVSVGSNDKIEANHVVDVNSLVDRKEEAKNKATDEKNEDNTETESSNDMGILENEAANPKLANRIECRPNIRSLRNKTQVIINPLLVKADPSKNDAILVQANDATDKMLAEYKTRSDHLKNNVDKLQNELDKIQEDNIKKDQSILSQALDREANKDTLIKYQKIMEDYQNHIIKQCKELCMAKEHSKKLARHFTNAEMAFSEVFEKYKMAKTVIEAYRKNEAIITENINNTENQLTQLVAKCKAMQDLHDQEIKRTQAQVDHEKDTYKHDMLKLQAVVKRLEIRASSLETSLRQKSEECQALSALCDDITGRKST